MGRSSFWFAHGYKGSNNKVSNVRGTTEMYDNFKANKKSKESFLEMRIKSLLDKYKNDKETQDKILGELNLYLINITIARELNDKNTEKNLTREFMKFLNQF